VAAARSGLERLHGASPDEFRRQPGEQRILHREGQQVVQIGRHRRGVEGQGGEGVSEAAFRLGLGRRALHTAHVLHDGQEGQIRDAVAIGKAGALDIGRILLRQPLLELIHQAALADARLPDHRHHPAIALLGLLPCRQELLEFGVAPDKLGQSPLRQHLEPACDGSRAQQCIGRHQFSLPLHR
jgi:hypothetical protein